MQHTYTNANGQRSETPLLTIAIPTYNRARYLRESLDTLLKQLSADSRLEFFISDNASSDDTGLVVEEFRLRGLPVIYYRNEINTGSDGNILRCFERAAGKYVWIVGDDDIILPGAIDRILELIATREFDLVYLQPYAFRQDYDREIIKDPYRRTSEILYNPIEFAHEAGQLIMFISSVITNKTRYNDIPTEDLQPLLGSSLVQMGWIFPVLANSSKTLVVHERLVAQRVENGGGWGVCQVFGINFFRFVDKYLKGMPALANEFRASMLRSWLPHMVMAVRLGTAGPLESENMRLLLNDQHRLSWRYHLYVYPLIVLPLPIARLWYSVILQLGRLTPARVKKFLTNRYIYFRNREPS